MPRRQDWFLCRVGEENSDLFSLLIFLPLLSSITSSVGTIISYEHSGFTNSCKPRFARYSRIRTDVTIKEHIQEDIGTLKEKVIYILRVLGNHEKNNGEGFRAAAYFKAVKRIHDIDAITEASLKSIKGIGPSLTEKIMCIVNTGTFYFQGEEEMRRGKRKGVCGNTS